MIPSRKENVSIKNLCNHRSEVKRVKSVNTTIAEVHALFESIIEHFPSISSKLTSSANIVKCPNFKLALVYIQMNREFELTQVEKISVEKLEMDCQLSSVDIDGMSLAEKSLQNYIQEKECSGNVFDTRFLMPTSSALERLFYKGRYALADNRESISPTDYEAQVFLYADRSLRGISDLNDMVK